MPQIKLREKPTKSQSLITRADFPRKILKNSFKRLKNTKLRMKF
jgi:hypothetical protein